MLRPEQFSSMKMQYGRKHKAVAPVLATLLMIAVAVAMSVILFMWSQGFLSNSSGAVGGQQGAQNQAAQSSVAISSATASDSSTAVSIVVTNVGAVKVALGSISITPASGNSGTWSSLVDTTLGGCSKTSLNKGESTACSETLGANAKSGDTLNIKVTTQVGTFATSQYTVP